MKWSFALFALPLSAWGCQSVEKEEPSPRPADFDRMVIIQDEKTANTIGGEPEKELKVR